VTAATGTLLLVPNALDLGTLPVLPLSDVLPAGVIGRAAALGHWVAEDAKSARAFLKRVDAITPLARALQAIDIKELPRPRKGVAAHAKADPAPDLRPLLAPALAGHDLGLLSEAGQPAVADPGAELVAAAHGAGIRVEPLAGPSSLMLALSASGLNGQSFAFVGYLPQRSPEREARIVELETISRRLAQTQIAIETPYRNRALLASLVSQLHPSTRMAVAHGLTLRNCWVGSRTVQQWRAAADDFGARVDNRTPAVFLWLAGSAR
jgi:16S rRNA (cytidine1402-2'-O)-methyltransferase